MSEATDRAAEVRHLGELAERLGAFLAARFATSCRVSGLRQLSGGWSRRTYLFELEGTSGEDLPRELVLRAESRGGMLDTRVEREYLILRALAGSRVPVPRVFAFSADPAVCGAPFVVMERVEGVVPNLWQSNSRRWVQEEPRRARLSAHIVEVLGAIHAFDWRAHGLGALGEPAPGTAYAAEQVAIWEERYRGVKVEPWPILEETFQWLRANLPPCDEPTLVDGDYRIGNMIVGDHAIHAVIDWELATIGDPIRDLGYTTLDYLAGKFLKRGRFLCNGLMETEPFLRAYEQVSGRTIDRRVFRFWQVFNVTCLATIVLTGTYGFVNGETNDLRMGWGSYAVYGLADDIARLLDF